jgi:hypothetical protein
MKPNSKPFNKAIAEDRDELPMGTIRSKLSKILRSISVISAFKTLRSTRCQPWDNRELDIVEGFKGVSLILIQIAATAVLIDSSARATPWSALTMKLTLFFTVV